ncbi:MAG: Asp-tRNA(Asn)/Glu-tRNA(Gln) amidotransferase subunit GatC [Propionibacteriaceae bacterium]|jgi:aspartyl-tRNA(Asn)/glutamyl-tRNA(Gln) amidotransferase subunit C|nr:Asp-tRNA(Asn)/Glu-tRNA(Gln) amidotransferase subunit GatC [Propionibacteriaceae bacterium]
MALSPDDVARLARLARIDLSQAELEHLAPQLDVILESVAEVSKVAADDVKPTSHAIEIANVFREDEVRPSFTAQQALSGAPVKESGRFRVPQILQEDE